MNKLNKAQLTALGPGRDHEVWVKLTRLDLERVVYEGPTGLYIQVRERDLRKRGEFHPAGEIVVITPTDIEWAETGQSGIEEDGTCTTEGYMMEIFENKFKGMLVTVDDAMPIIFGMKKGHMEKTL